MVSSSECCRSALSDVFTPMSAECCPCSLAYPTLPLWHAAVIRLKPHRLVSTTPPWGLSPINHCNFVFRSLAATNKIQGSARWYKNMGGNPPTFTASVIYSNTAFGVYTSGLFLQDFDSDGRTDVVVVNSGLNSVIVYRNNGGTPVTFTNSTLTTTASGVQSVWAADLVRPELLYTGDGRCAVVAGEAIL